MELCLLLGHVNDTLNTMLEGMHFLVFVPISCSYFLHNVSFSYRYLMPSLRLCCQITVNVLYHYASSSSFKPQSGNSRHGSGRSAHEGTPKCLEMPAQRIYVADVCSCFL